MTLLENVSNERKKEKQLNHVFRLIILIFPSPFHINLELKALAHENECFPFPFFAHSYYFPPFFGVERLKTGRKLKEITTRTIPNSR
jgi:hypothetical protein